MSITVPMDIYVSPTEMVIILPLGGVEKTSIKILCKENILHINGMRKKKLLKENLMPIQESCFWGIFEKEVELPENAAFDRIQSELSPENILTIIVPKIVIPEEIIVKTL